MSLQSIEQAKTYATRPCLLTGSAGFARAIVFLRLVRYGLGGTVFPGDQFVSWIHEADFIRAVEFLIATPSITGPVNLASPHPLPNRQFLQVLRTAWGARVGLPTFSWMLEIGTLLLRTESELVLKSRRVVPGRLLEAGFTFTYPTWGMAAPDLIAGWHSRIDRAF